MEERYAVGELKKDIFEKFNLRITAEVETLKTELAETLFDSSNLNPIVEKGILIAENLSQLWLSSDFSHKQKLQYLVFPDGILYNKKKDRVLTQKVNALFAEIPLLKQVSAENEKSNLQKDCLQSNKVTPIGFKPITF